MRNSSLSQALAMITLSFPRWLRWCCIITLAASVGLLSVSVFARNYHTIIAPNLVPWLAVALSFAVFLNMYSFWQIQREHREADQAFRNADCEFFSIFQNVLDGILIVDNEGICLDANPAAAAILRLPINKLIGESVDRFLLERDGFGQRWNSFLQNRSQRGRAQLIADDG